MRLKPLVPLALVVTTLGLAWLGWVSLSPGASARVDGLFPYDDPAVLALGKPLYADNCASCHGANLQGEPNWRDRDSDGYLPAPPPHDDSGHTWHHPPDAQLFAITKHGTSALVGGVITSPAWTALPIALATPKSSPFWLYQVHMAAPPDHRAPQPDECRPTIAFKPQRKGSITNRATYTPAGRCSTLPKHRLRASPCCAPNNPPTKQTKKRPGRIPAPRPFFNFPSRKAAKRFSLLPTSPANARASVHAAGAR